MTTSFARIGELFAAMGSEPLTPRERQWLAESEAALVVMLSKARKRAQCERELYELGAIVAARRCGCHRATVYRRAKVARNPETCDTK